MLRFVIRKMLNKKWMVLSLLVGNILLISIAASNPMYTDAVLKRTLDTDIPIMPMPSSPLKRN